MCPSGALKLHLPKTEANKMTNIQIQEKKIQEGWRECNKTAHHGPLQPAIV